MGCINLEQEGVNAETRTENQWDASRGHEKGGRKQEVVADSVSSLYRLISTKKEASDLKGICVCPGSRSKPRDMGVILVIG